MKGHDTLYPFYPKKSNYAETEKKALGGGNLCQIFFINFKTNRFSMKKKL